MTTLTVGSLLSKNISVSNTLVSNLINTDNILSANNSKSLISQGQLVINTLSTLYVTTLTAQNMVVQNNLSSTLIKTNEIKSYDGSL